MELPEKYEPHTDRYFIRTRKILEKLDYNPTIGMKCFFRKSIKKNKKDFHKVFESIFNKYRPDFNGEIYCDNSFHYDNNTSAAIIEGNAQEIVELETLYLSELTSIVNSYNENEVTNNAFNNMIKLNEIFDVDIIYFGARHYNWRLNKKISRNVLEAGANQTSTDSGSAFIGEKGVGTTPHFLTILMAKKYNKDVATVKTASHFDEYMPEDIPRVTLVDTFNQEYSDSLDICKMMDNRYDNWNHKFRIDTCGENMMYHNDKKKGDIVGNIEPNSIPNNIKNSKYFYRKGVSILPLMNYRLGLIDKGYGENTDIIISSGFGNQKKAKEFARANKWFSHKFGYKLFSSVGIGGVTDRTFATADIYSVDGEPLAKTGREVNLDTINKTKENQMSKVI